MMTHRAREAAMTNALDLLREMDVVNEVGSLVRVEEWE